MDSKRISCKSSKIDTYIEIGIDDPYAEYMKRAIVRERRGDIIFSILG